jgi:multiple sugar transport system ATP-binding protein
MASVNLRGVEKSFGAAKVIKSVELEIQNGEFCVLVGPSGCGKSTLLRMIAGLETISGGELLMGGRLANDLSPRERGVAMVFQSYAIFPHMSVRDNIGFGLRLNGVQRPERDRRVEEAADTLQITHLLDRKPAQLSGGQRQRVAIGRAIVRKPEVFLFDEPLSNLDASLRQSMRLEIATLHKQLKTTMIYVTHDQVEAMTLADKIVVMKDGVVQQVGAPIELFQRPQSRFVAGFIGAPSMNFLEVEVYEVESDRAVVVSQTLQSLSVPIANQAERAKLRPGDRGLLAVRPQYLHPAGGRPPFMIGRVNGVERLGVETIVSLTAGSEKVLMSLPEDRSFSLDDEIGITFEPARSLLFASAE